MELDHGRADCARGLDLRGSGSMNSETRMPASLSAATASASCRPSPADVEPALGGHLLAPLGHEADGVRRAGGGRSPPSPSVTAISRFSGTGSSASRPLDVVVLDVAAVLAQVDGDAVGAGLGRQHGRRAPGRDRAPPRALRDGGDVVDVDAEPQAARTWLVMRLAPGGAACGRWSAAIAIAAIRLSGRADALAGDVERRAVVGRGAHERQARASH